MKSAKMLYSCLLLGTCMSPSKATASAITLSIEAKEYNSCPFVYTWDGQSYQKENDIYSVGRGKSKEFTDYLNILNQVTPKDGSYSFQIREINGETSWTDVLKLMVIDHPADVRVGVDSSGNIHSYKNLVPPDAAVNEAGSDISAKIAAQDDITVDMYNNSIVTLDFSSIDISNGAKLVMDLNGFEGKVGGNFIPVTPAIYIQTLESGEWVTRHTFFPKEEWAAGVFDLKPYLVESKKVRLVGASCFDGKYHLVDYIGIDNTPDRISSVEVLDPQSAILNDTLDVLNDITTSDDIYVNMIPNDVMAVTFAYNPPEGDAVRSFAFISEGYYKPLGNTYYVDTWTGSSWVERFAKSWPMVTSSPNTTPDTTNNVDLSAYLPDSNGEYKVRVRNTVMANSLPGYPTSWAYLDYVKLTVDGTSYNPSYAQQYTPAMDILSLVSSSDNSSWDAANKSALIKFNVNRTPIAACKDIVVNLNANGNISISADQVNNGSSDPDGDPLTLSVSPAYFDCSNVGANTVTLTATDSKGASNNCQATVTVQDKVAPIVKTKNITVQLDASGKASISAPAVDGGSTDNCCIASKSVSKSSFTCADVGQQAVTLTVTDCNGNSSSATASVTVQDKVAPTVKPKNITVQLDASGKAFISAPDVDGGSTDNCCIASKSVSKSSFTCADVGQQAVTLTVTDCNGNSSSATANVTVQDKVAPVVKTKNITVQLDASGKTSIIASDVDNGSADNCCIASRSLSKNSFTCADIGQQAVTLTVTDCNGNSSSAMAAVTVQDKVAPTVKTKNVTVQLDAEGKAAIVGSDVDGGTTDACGIASLAVDPLSFTCSNLGTNIVTLTATDKNGNAASAAATVTVADTLAPTNVQANATATITPPDAPISFKATATDNCSASVRITDYFCYKVKKDGSQQSKMESCVVNVSGDTLTIANSGGVGDNIIWTVLATDQSGNTATAKGSVLVANPSNNGVGNGQDPQPPGNPPVNDGAGTSPGNPGNKKK